MAIVRGASILGFFFLFINISLIFLLNLLDLLIQIIFLLAPVIKRLELQLKGRVDDKRLRAHIHIKA